MRTIKYKNGDVYVGYTVGLFKPERWGEGTMTYARGGVYKGEWRNNVRHGKGTYTYANGDVYVGYWNNDKMTNGRIDYKDGSYYEGEFSGGMRSGNGKLYDKSTDTTYVGHFSSGKKYGVGTETCPEYTYKGRFTMDKFQFEGRLDWKNGDWEEGTFNRGRLDRGKCKRTEKDGSFYEGEIARGVYEGAGELRLSDGSVYIGKFLGGKYHGLGKLVNADGTVQEGEFSEGRFCTAVKATKKSPSKTAYVDDKATVKKGKPATPVDINKIFSTLKASVKGSVDKALACYDKVVNPKPFTAGLPVVTPKAVAAEAREYAENARKAYARFEERAKKENVYGSPLQSASATKCFFDSVTGKNNVYRGGLNYKGQPHGYGRLDYADGRVYEGELEWGVCCGVGKFRDSNYTYTGEFSKDGIDGTGVLVYDTGSTYTGKFISGNIKSGVYVNAANTLRYEGEFNKEMKREGCGIIYVDGTEIGSRFIGGDILGYGYYKSADGIFRGYYSAIDGKGCGVTEYHDGSRYEGDVTKYKPEGYGRFTDTNGNVISGSFSNGSAHGYCEITYKEGMTVRGWFQNNELKLKL